MQVTISSFLRHKNQQQSPYQIKSDTQQTHGMNLEETDIAFPINCPGFGNCLNQNTSRMTEQQEVVKGYQLPTNPLIGRTEPTRKQNLLIYQNARKHKICLSLKRISQYQFTPKKITNQNKCYSQNKKDCVSNSPQYINKNLLTVKSKLKFDKHRNMTEPVKLEQSAEKNTPKLKESLIKPSTNVMTPGSKSLRQSTNSNSKKAKLTLSNNFKSSISEEKFNQKLSADQSCIVETGLASHQVFIEQSFMTEKMRNIYQEKSTSFLKQPSSNIVYYNQLMNNQTVWKYPIDAQVDSSRNQQNNTTILQQLQEEQDHHLPEMYSPNKQQMRVTFAGRKCIGDYAKTIKTFNQSEQKEDSESVVLEHGFLSLGRFPTSTLNRGSIKEFPSEYKVFRRQYNSFGQQGSFNLGKSRQQVSHPIEENSFDSQKQS